MQKKTESKTEKKPIKELLELIPQQPPRKGTVDNQLKLLIHFAERVGLLDASAYIKRVVGK